MSGDDDHDLLRQYAREGSQPAFAELVQRHVNLVYSAARRQIRSAALAEEIAQSVFVDLARHASQIKAATPLVAWLHVVTRRTAIDTIRRESRRQAREQTAVEIAAMKPSPSIWKELEPLLDEALDKLDEADRASVLLRYFENKTLREVGLALGSSEEAAQKRVSRATERLRTFFAKRGVVVGASGLVAELSAHAIQTAPAVLGPAITSAVPLSAAVAALTATTKTLVMTTAQKTLIAATVAVAIGGGLFELREFARLRAEISTQQQLADRREAEAKNLERERELAARKRSAADAEIGTLLTKIRAPAPAGETLEPEMQAWLARLDRLKQLRGERAELTIPELELIEERTWFVVAQKAKLDTDAGIREAFATLRRVAENSFANNASSALNAYLQANAGHLPATPDQLALFFDPPIDPSVFQRYKMLQSGRYADLPKGGMPVLAAKSPVDLERDSVWLIGPSFFSSSDAMSYNVRQAIAAFGKANPGQRASNAIQLVPFLPFPASVEAVQKIMFPAPPAREP